MRVLSTVCLFAALLSTTEALACKSLVEFDAHLSGSEPGWFKDYRLAEIVEVHRDRLVVNVKRRFDGAKIVTVAMTLPFNPNEEAHAVCETRFEVGQTYLLHLRKDGAYEQISRYNGYDIPSEDPKYQGYVRDLERASAANTSLERARRSSQPLGRMR
jgi:hypothetical protein